MGQKINPNILRLGITKYWKTEFFEKTSKELPRYTFKDLELKNYIERFLDTNGLFLHDYRQNFSDSTLTFYTSYFITTSIFTKIKIKKKLTKMIIVNNKGEKKWIVKINANNPNKKDTNLYRLKNPFITFKSKISITKINKYLISKHYLKIFFIWHSFNKRLKKNGGILKNFFKTINLFTHNTNNIILNVSCFNKELRLKTNKDNIKQLSLKLKRFKNTDFYKNGIELLLNCITNKNSANLLSKYVALQIRNNKKHKFFLSFLKKVFLPILNSSVSVLKGIKIKIKGRLNGAPKAKHKSITIGDIPTQSIDSFLDFSQAAVHTKNGTYGIKVWIASKV